MSWWSEALADRRQAVPENPRVPQIPQSSPADDLGDLVEQARARMQKAAPARSFEERFGRSPGQDIGTTPRRPGPAREVQSSDDLLNLSPQERAVVVALGTQGGKFGNERAKDARDHAAEVQQLTRISAPVLRPPGWEVS